MRSGDPAAEQKRREALSAEEKEMRKHLWKRVKAVLVTAVLLALSASVPASAGVWRTGEDDPESWWYDHQDGTWAVGWELIDGNGDGLGEWYLFDEDGWLLTDFITTDGYEIDENGAWVQNGAVVRNILFPPMRCLSMMATIICLHLMIILRIYELTE